MAGGRINRGGERQAYREMNEDEKAVKERWEAKDRELDDQIELALEGILSWKKKAIAIGDQQDIINEKTNQLEKNVDDGLQSIKRQNYKLKKIVE